MLKKLLLLFAIACAPALAAYTTVSDTLYQANGNLYSGIIDIAWQTFTGADGRAMPAGHFQLKVASGVLSVALEPNDTATPSGTSYRITYALNSGLPSPEYWVVPTSISPVNLATVRTTPPPTPTFTFAAGQITGVLVRNQGGTNNTAGAIAQLFHGSGSPGSVTGNLSGDFYDDLTNHLLYFCAAAFGASTPACTTVASGGWTLTGSGSGGTAIPPYVTTISGSTTTTITAVTHGQGISAIAFCYSNNTPIVAVACAYTRNSSGDLAFTFNPSFSGTIEIISGGGGFGPYVTTVTGVTSQSISAATHGKGTTPFAVCYTNASPAVAVACTYTVDGSGNFAFTFNPAFTGIIQVRP